MGKCIVTASDTFFLLRQALHPAAWAESVLANVMLMQRPHSGFKVTENIFGPGLGLWSSQRDLYFCT